MNLELTNKIALVTGSNRGTGEVIARRLEEEGATVVRQGNDRQSYELIKENDPEKLVVWGDISSHEGCNQCLDQLWQLTPSLDILVNNYGTTSYGKWEEYKEEDWLDIYQKNVLSAARISSAVIPRMKASGWGRIIQLSTIGSLSPNARMPHYYASKGALSNLSVSLAKELSGTGITVNTVSPGLILTEELKAAYLVKAKRKGWGDDWETIEAKIVEHDFPNLCGKIASREEVADLVCFLCSTRSGFINAQNLRIDGGSLALTV